MNADRKRRLVLLECTSLLLDVAQVLTGEAARTVDEKRRSDMLYKLGDRVSALAIRAATASLPDGGVDDVDTRAVEDASESLRDALGLDSDDFTPGLEDLLELVREAASRPKPPHPAEVSVVNDGTVVMMVDGEPKPVEVRDGRVRVSDSAPWLLADDAIGRVRARTAIFSVRQAIVKTDLPWDTSSADAVRELWRRLMTAEALLGQIRTVARERLGDVGVGSDMVTDLDFALARAVAADEAGTFDG